jgi:hypothetical protein
LLRHAASRARVSSGTKSVDSSIVTPAVNGLAAIGAAFGADASLASETTIGPGNDDIWLVPGAEGACLVDLEGPQGAGSTCDNASTVDAGAVWTLDTVPYGVGGAMTQVLIGAAPDRDTLATVMWTGGGSTVVPVSNNIYSVPIGAHTGWISVTLTNSSGVGQEAVSGNAGSAVTHGCAPGGFAEPPEVRGETHARTNGQLPTTTLRLASGAVEFGPPSPSRCRRSSLRPRAGLERGRRGSSTSAEVAARLLGRGRPSHPRAEWRRPHYASRAEGTYAPRVT